MPKLPADDDRFHGFDKNQFESRLPSGDLIEKGAVDPYFAALLRASWTQAHTENYLQIAQGIVRRIAKVEGIPTYHLPAMSKLFETAQDIAFDPKSVDWKRVAPDAIIGGLKTVDATLKTVGTSVPILKWFVAIGEAVHKLALFISDVLQDRNARGKPIPPAALVYARDTDGDITESLLEFAPAKDWTDVFLPFEKLSGMPKFRGNELDYTGHGLPGGAQVTFGDADPSGKYGGNRAVLPGFARICGPRIQARDLGPGYKFASWSAYTEETGDLLPSACQAGLTLWHFAMKNGPNMWKLDPDAIIAGWENYFHALHVWGAGAWQRGRSEVPEYLLAAVNYAAHWAARFAPGKEPRPLTAGIEWRDVPAKFKSYPYTNDQLVAWQLRGVWEPRLRRSLGTLTCAYIDETYPTLKWAKKARPELFRRWESMREQLLRHPARALVDLDLVAEGDWKARLITARKNAATDLANVPEGGDRPDLTPDVDLSGEGPLPTHDWNEPPPELPDKGSFDAAGTPTAWDDTPAFEPVEANAPTPDKGPSPVFGERVSRRPWWVAAGMAAGVAFVLRF